MLYIRISSPPCRSCKSRVLTFRRNHTPKPAQVPIINIPKADVYRFGDPNTSRPMLHGVQWRVLEGESWAVISTGSGEKHSLFQMLLGHLRIYPPPPPPPGLFPFLSVPSSGPPRDPYKCISIVSFGNRRRAAGGAFFDYTARYGAVREEDRLTLRQSMFPELIPPDFDIDPSALPVLNQLEDKKLLETLLDKMDLRDLLDLPLVALSNGQTRRARIAKAILSEPELLLLDEPLTGIDIQSRPRLLEIFHSLHTTRSPRIIIGLRTQDPLPEWITHVALVRNRRVLTGPKEKILVAAYESKSQTTEIPTPTSRKISNPLRRGNLLVDMRSVTVKYGPRTVLNDIHWQIHQGDRWHLQGANGSGKTTLLSLITGDHPQSYIQQHLHLPSFSNTPQPRKKIPTPYLHSLVGVMSPELFDAFPRRSGMTVWDVVGTGFDGTFVPRGRKGVGVGTSRSIEDGGEGSSGESERGVEWRVQRCWEVLKALGPLAWGGFENEGPTMRDLVTEQFKSREFVELSVGEQRMVLLMRALVGKPRLVLLDEVWSGMDERMIEAARRYMRDGGVGHEQAVVVVTHWEEEVPWGMEDGVRKYVLENGHGMQY